jgi:hypothetical protein
MQQKTEKQIEEGLTDTVARGTALIIKRKVIQLGRKVRSAKDIDQKLDFISIQLSSLAALTLLAISVGGDGLLSKAGIVSGLFTEDFPDDK